MATCLADGDGMPRIIDLPAESARPADAQPLDEGLPAVDEALIARGEVAFQTACTHCHDAQRAWQKTKSRSGWRLTVRRMSAKPDADISADDIEPISAYLASLGRGEPTNEHNDLADATGPSFFATIAPLFRDAGGETAVENSGFFADAWFGLEYSSRAPLRGNITLCTSCHSPSQEYSLEVVELTVTFDLQRAFCPCDSAPQNWAASIKAGRFVVPFGAYAARSHPGVSRTLTNPLMYNMGRRVFGNVGPPRQPVLPIPYADEGVDLHASISFCDDASATFDLYGVNGLQEGSLAPGTVFFTSRSYTDNNSRPAIGGRVTVGNSLFRVGGSLMAGEYQDAGAERRQYRISGVDATARYEDIARLSFEYAIRQEDSLAGPGTTNLVYGTVTEAEICLLSSPRIGLLARYDTLSYRDSFGLDADMHRFTWGFTIVLPGGSLLIVNHEHWRFPPGQSDVDVVGTRWVVAF